MFSNSFGNIVPLCWDWKKYGKYQAKLELHDEKKSRRHKYLFNLDDPSNYRSLKVT